MFSLNLDKDGRILSATFQKFAPADSVLVNAIPDGNIYEYRYVDGEFVHDPLAEPEAEPTHKGGLDIYSNRIHGFFPVGAVYAEANNEDPASVFGGTWSLVDSTSVPGVYFWKRTL